VSANDLQENRLLKVVVMQRKTGRIDMGKENDRSPKSAQPERNPNLFDLRKETIDHQKALGEKRGNREMGNIEELRSSVAFTGG